MKKWIFLFTAAFTAACSSLIPYKDQNLEYLYHIQESPEAYKGAVVAFEGEVMGVKETPQSLRMILKINVPLYYYATGKGNSLSYEFLLADFAKEAPAQTGIQKGERLKVLARVDGYETRTTPYGQTTGAVRVNAIALAARKNAPDIFSSEESNKALYESWKSGKLFFNESAAQVLQQQPAAQNASN